jgi:hypothetical protein
MVRRLAPTAQQPDVAPALDHQGAKGVEDDETAHQQRQDAQEAEEGLAHGQVGQQLFVGRQRPELVGIAHGGRQRLLDFGPPGIVHDP